MPGIFVDTGIFVALSNRKDRDHKRSVDLADKLRRGEFGQAYTSEYVFDEAVTTALVRTGRREAAVKAGKMVLGSKEESIPALARLVRVDELAFREAWERFQSGKFAGLSFTDHTILAQMNDLKVDLVLSFDGGFDGKVSRIS
jgi:predicted nucleic acid-binding protein